tara:strand:+ start:42120 stop:42467 length:348 start_codon:yes stop_codon:yes gene_type:complete
VKILFLLLFSFNAESFDPDQKLSKCGEYQAFGSISCQGAGPCELVIASSKQSKLLVSLIPPLKNISYFSGQDIMVNIGIHSLEKPLKASVLSAPIQQLRAIKKAGLSLKKEKICK